MIKLTTLLTEIQTEADDKVKKQAKQMGLVSLGGTAWGKEAGGETTHINQGGKLVPYTGNTAPSDTQTNPMDKAFPGLAKTAQSGMNLRLKKDKPNMIRGPGVPDATDSYGTDDDSDGVIAFGNMLKQKYGSGIPKSQEPEVETLLNKAKRIQYLYQTVADRRNLDDEEMQRYHAWGDIIDDLETHGHTNMEEPPPFDSL